mmetsp:Transcript_20516/g.56662  ORF Transcript_20516/g.56662 Transcript_20516/m.56662 type:complete len:207 (+) Transcript_20516:3-623(+)
MMHRIASGCARRLAAVAAPGGARLMSECAPQAPWWDKGIKFSCTQCGRCCTRPGIVMVNDKEIAEMAKSLDSEESAFREKYVLPDLFAGRRLIRQYQGQGCSLLDANRNCSVYKARPTQCRTYPFWPHLLRSRDEMLAEGDRYCEGIRVAPSPETDALEPISREEVILNAKVQSLYTDGGQETYDGSMAALRQDMSRLPEYEREFS